MITLFIELMQQQQLHAKKSSCVWRCVITFTFEKGHIHQVEGGHLLLHVSIEPLASAILSKNISLLSLSVLPLILLFIFMCVRVFVVYIQCVFRVVNGRPLL